MKERNRPGDPNTPEELLKLQSVESGLGENVSGQQVGGGLTMVDIVLPNEGTPDELDLLVGRLLVARGLI